MSDLASVLIVGSHPELTAAVADAIRARGFSVRGVIGAEAGLAALDEGSVDAMVLGGPSAMSRHVDLIDKLHAKNRWAKVIVPTSPGGALAAIERLFERDAN